MLELLLYIAGGIYVLEYLFFYTGMRRALRVPVRSKGEELPSVTIVVAARNEEANIEACLRALVGQEYPADRLQVITVNDESEDATLTIMHRVARESAGQLKVISTIPERSSIGGKARAIAQGMDHATGELILLTDADCVPPATWTRSVVDHFLPDVDIVAGFTVVRAGNLFSRLQQLDWLHLQSMAAASMGFGSPVGVIGNNLAFRRRAYERVGGYRNLPFSVTEDFALFRAMDKSGCRTVYPCCYEGCVVTEPCGSLAAVLRQKHRWGRGGMESSLHGYSIIVVAFLMLLALCIAPFVSFTAWAIVWGTKFLADLLLLLPAMRQLRLLDALKSFIPFQFYFIAQALVVPLLLLNRNVTWKGRVFQTVGAKVRV